jgi:hypothetical protein
MYSTAGDPAGNTKNHSMHNMIVYNLQCSCMRHYTLDMQGDTAGESDAKAGRQPGEAPWAGGCRHAAEVASAHAKHAWSELRAGRITPQVLAAMPSDQELVLHACIGANAQGWQAFLLMRKRPP